MVYLNRIYTRTGDDGQTSLGNGTRVPKTAARIQAYGGVDELNSVIGVVLQAEHADAVRQQLIIIQNDLFDLGADLCVPPAEDEANAEHPPLRVTADQVARLEAWIDRWNEPLPALTSFVLPGGTAAAAHLHVARAVCRRIEIGVLALGEQEPVNPQAMIYLNRLSDLLFVLARSANQQEEATGDVLWTPGKHRQET